MTRCSSSCHSTKYEWKSLNMKYFLFSFMSIFVLLVLGCSKTEQTKQESSKKPQDTLRVALLGDQTRNKMLGAIGAAVNAKVESSENVQSIQFLSGNKNIQIDTATDENLVHHAKIASQADIVLLADNAADGPMPIHREHVILIRQMNVPQAMMLFTNCDLVEDPELLELLELEMRELFNNYGLSGDAAQCVFDQENAKTSSKSKTRKGPEEIVDLITKSSMKRLSTPDSKSIHSFSAEVYSLAKTEAPQGAMTIATGPLTIILNGNTLEAEVAKTDGIVPGAHGQLLFKAKDAINTSIGQRFIILNRDHIAGVGVVAETMN